MFCTIYILTAVTLEKEGDINRIQKAYEALTENQKKQVTNKDILDQANEHLEEIRTAVTEGEKVAELLAEGFMNRDSYQIKQIISAEMLGESGEEAIDDIMILFSKEVWIQLLVEELFNGEVAYKDLNYFGRQAIDRIAESYVSALLFTRYEVNNVRYIDGKVLAEVVLFMKYNSGIQVDIGELIDNDMTDYVEQNKSWLQYSMYGKSEKEIVIEVFNLVAISNADAWVREVQKLGSGEKETSITQMVQVEETNDGWKITNMELEW